MKVKNKKKVIESLDDCISYLNKQIGRHDKPNPKKTKPKLQKAS
jgi:hypothetical protein